jgi:hypothetical protein
VETQQPSATAVQRKAQASITGLLPKRSVNPPQLFSETMPPSDASVVRIVRSPIFIGSTLSTYML